VDHWWKQRGGEKWGVLETCSPGSLEQEKGEARVKVGLKVEWGGMEFGKTSGSVGGGFLSLSEYGGLYKRKEGVGGSGS